jgi:hypothetical protein
MIAGSACRPAVRRKTSRVRRWRGVVRLACGAYQTVRFHPLLIEPDMRISLHPALGQSITPSPTARPDQAG